MPVITNVIERRKGTWVELFVADESIRLPIETAGGLTTGTEFAEEDWMLLKRESQFYLLFDKALRLLGMREHFALELQRKLAQRTLDKTLIGRVLEACRQRGYLDDTRAADYLTTQVLQRGGMGRLKLRAMLKERGCPDELLEQSLQRFTEELDEAATAEELLQLRRNHFAYKRDRIREKLEGREDISPRKVRMLTRVKLGQLVGTYLYARGFSGDEINRAGRKLVEELIAEIDPAMD